MVLWLTLATNANAWEPIGVWAWLPDERIRYVVADDCPLPGAECVDAVQRALAAWEAVPCTGIRFQFEGVVPPEQALLTGDGRIGFSFADTDPDWEGHQLRWGAVYSRGVAWPGADRFDDVLSAYDATVLGREGVDWTTDPRVQAGLCTPGQPNLDTYLVHEVGHLLGLNHPCVPGDCDPADADAVMQEEIADDCSLSRPPADDDREGVTAWYAPHVQIVCSEAADLERSSGGPLDGVGRIEGGAPFSVHCTLASQDLDDVFAARWTFGDGGEAWGIAVEHTYEREGVWSIEVELDGDPETCPPGVWGPPIRQQNRVTICGVPEPTFTMEPVGDLKWRVLHEAAFVDTTCLQNLRWDVYRGTDRDGSLVFSSTHWAPTIPFPEPGDYTVVLHVGGPGGTGAAATTLQVSPGSPLHCGGTSSAYTSFSALFPLALLRRRR